MGAFEGVTCPANIVNTGASANQVNIDDLLAVISAWGPCPRPPATCPADIAPAPCGDGDVDIDDLLMVVSFWGCCPGFSCTPTDMPEDFWDCYDKCSEEPDFGDCMDDCFKALCELGHTQYCD